MKTLSLAQRKEMENLEEKRDLEMAVIRTHVPKTDEEVLCLTQEQRKQREIRRIELAGLQPELEVQVEGASEVEQNIEPKKLNTNLFKFNLDLANLNGILESMKVQIGEVKDQADDMQKAIDKKPET